MSRQFTCIHCQYGPAAAIAIMSWASAVTRHSRGGGGVFRKTRRMKGKARAEAETRGKAGRKQGKGDARTRTIDITYYYHYFLLYSLPLVVVLDVLLDVVVRIHDCYLSHRLTTEDRGRSLFSRGSHDVKSSLTPFSRAWSRPRDGSSLQLSLPQCAGS